MKWLAIIFTSVLVSCTVTKRVHQPGYHIEWRTKTVSVTEDKSQEEGLTTSQFLPEKSLEEAQIYNEPSKTLDAFLEEEDDRTESFTEQKGITSKFAEQSLKDQTVFSQKKVKEHWPMMVKKSELEKEESKIRGLVIGASVVFIIGAFLVAVAALDAIAPIVAIGAILVLISLILLAVARYKQIKNYNKRKAAGLPVKEIKRLKRGQKILLIVLGSIAALALLIAIGLSGMSYSNMSMGLNIAG